MERQPNPSKHPSGRRDNRPGEQKARAVDALIGGFAGVATAWGFSVSTALLCSLILTVPASARAGRFFQSKRPSSAGSESHPPSRSQPEPHPHVRSQTQTGAPSQPPGTAASANPQNQHPGQEQKGQVRNNNQQEHLSEWLNRHQNMTLEEQQKALTQEPGFNQLPAETQQRMQERLLQLDTMNPVQRQRVLNRVETMERLTPQQRNQVRMATQQWGQLPEDRRRMVGKAFHDLREMPVEQRQAILNSERFKGQFDDHERNVLHSLLNVEPYLSAPNATDPPQYVGK